MQVYYIPLLTMATLFFLIAVTGREFEIRGTRIPKIPLKGRVASGILGATVFSIFIFMVFDFQPSSGNDDSPRRKHDCRRPNDLPAVAEGNRTETEIRDFLESEGFFNVQTQPAFVPGALKGMVVGQDPSPGTIRCPRDKVIIKVSR